jgi:hypothetical protein
MTMDSDAPAELVIRLSKSKLVLLILGAVAFVGASVWIWSISEIQTRFDPLFVKAIAVAGVSFFGLCAIYGCFKVFDFRPGLIIDDQGIVDNSSAVAAGRILWHEVIGLKVSEIARQRFITIEVVDPKRFVDRGSFLSRMLNAANTKMTGSPINISSNTLCIEFDDLVQALTEAFRLHKEPGRTSGWS